MGNRWKGPAVGSRAPLPEPKLLVEKASSVSSCEEGGTRPTSNKVMAIWLLQRYQRRVITEDFFRQNSAKIGENATKKVVTTLF